MFERLTPLYECPAGQLAGLLGESYAPLLLELGPQEASELRNNWLEFDAAVQHNPGGVGASGFVSWVDGEIVGFASWDPRGWPALGRVGHNCIRPQYQGRGHGARQIAAILHRFRTGGFASARARTGEHPFFAPARGMYLRCGFHVAAREPGLRMGGYGAVVYEIALTDKEGAAEPSVSRSAAAE